MIRLSSVPLKMFLSVNHNHKQVATVRPIGLPFLLYTVDVNVDVISWIDGGRLITVEITEGGYPIAPTKLAWLNLVHTFMVCLLSAHLPCTHYFNPIMKSVQKINFAMKWEEKR